jgi:4-amino-4-deoxy-L-arabinose transferase-like glycosyltransferase
LIESHKFSRARVHVLAIFAFWLAVYVPGLFRPPLMDDADSVHAEAAREMVQTHDWVTLRFNGIRYMEKAPLMYWAVASSYEVFGIHDWSTRLPLTLGVLSLLFVVYGFGRHYFGEAGGFYAALATGLGFGSYIYTRFLIPDILVGLWTILALAFFLRTLEEAEPSRYSCWGLAVACALNVLTKGLIGLVFPLAAIGFYLVLTGNLRHLLRMRFVSSTLVFLSVAAPWHILAGMRNPSVGTVRGFFWFYFVNEQFLRYINKRVPRDYDTVPLLVFWGLVLVWLFPWSSFLPQALARVPLFRPRDAAKSRVGRAGLLLFLAGIFIVLFFTFSTRQEYYVLPAIPVLALLIGSWLGEEEASPLGSRLRKWGRVSSSVLVALGVLVSAATIYLAVGIPQQIGSANIAELIHSGPANSQQYALSLGHVLDLNLRVMTLFGTPLLIFGLALLVGSVLNWYFRRKVRPRLGNWSLAVMGVFLLTAIHSALITFSPLLSSKPLADAILSVYKNGDIIEINGEYEGGSTVGFYTGKMVRIMNGRGKSLWYGSFFPDAPQIFDDTTTFQRMWKGPSRVFLWTEIEERESAVEGLDPNSVFVLARFGNKLILTNQPAR